MDQKFRVADNHQKHLISGAEISKIIWKKEPSGFDILWEIQIISCCLMMI